MLCGDAGGYRRVVGLAVALVALSCALWAPSFAAAESFLVNSVGDETDAVPGDEFCVTAAAKCTLRAAIEESNALSGGDSLDFEEEGLFDGGVGGTIVLAKPLPTIEGEIEIFGECVPSEEVLRPCVGVDGPTATGPAISVKNAEGVTISGLAITGAGTGIDVLGTTRFKSLGNWFGVKLDRTIDGNETGILLGPAARRSLIGNGGETPNVFAGGETGLDIFGAAETEVLGNLFGVGPDGVTVAPLAVGIEVTGVESGAAATGTRIGAALSPAARATTACDGGCNVIAGGAIGIDLEADDSGEVPAADTSIRGNYVGLGVDGTTAVHPGISGVGVGVGAAPRTAIGGPRAGEANRFSGGAEAVNAKPGAGGLIVRGNSIGLDAEGEQSVAPSAYGIFVTAEAAAGPEAILAGNGLAMEGGTGILQKGFGAWITGNEISGAANGIETGGAFDESGNLIEGNLVEGSAKNAVLLASDQNEVLGNELLDSGEAGVLVSGEPPFGVSGNRIGGDTAEQENVISGATGAAIEIANAQSSENVVARNRGGGNGGPFIDLVSLDPLTEPKGPNSGAAPPVFLAATTTAASGQAKPEAVVRVFLQTGPAASGIESFLGEAVADEDGLWAVAYADPAPAGSYIAATQTLEGRQTSELRTVDIPATPNVPETPETPEDPAIPGTSDTPGSSDGCSAASCSAAISDSTPPLTAILKHPKKKSAKATARFTFEADEAGASFQCKLDKKQFAACGSPKKYKHLKPGKHVFQVRATDPSGNAEATPAKYKFTVSG